MRELDDLRGATLSWVVSRRSPLLCAISQQSGSGGSLVGSIGKETIEAFLAGVRWRIHHGLSGNVVQFEDGPTICEAHTGASGYLAEIDGIARYEFGPRRFDPPGEGRYREAWIDAAGRHAVLFRRHRHSDDARSGEILVSASATIEHVPILILLGIVHVTLRRIVLQ